MLRSQNGAFPLTRLFYEGDEYLMATSANVCTALFTFGANVQMCTNVQMSNVQIHKCANMFKCANMCKCTNAQICKNENMQMCNCVQMCAYSAQFCTVLVNLVAYTMYLFSIRQGNVCI